MRDLLRSYADRGATVLLSSHLLHEIEVVADDLVVIGSGRVVAQGTKADLLAGGGTLARTPHVDQLADALADHGLTCTRNTTATGATLRVDAEPEVVGRIAHQASVLLIELRPADGAGLEEMFLALTAGIQREGAAAA